MDHCIVYVSAAVKLFTEEDLNILLLQSRHHNSQVNITGVLMCIHGNIIQVLEGPKGLVDALYSRIKVDGRHSNVVEVFNRQIPMRQFPFWAMGYETITAYKLEEIIALMRLEKQSPDSRQGIDHLLIKLIRTFFHDTTEIPHYSAHY